MAGVFETLVGVGLLTPDTGEAMIRAVGFRNLTVHGHASINWGIVRVVTAMRLDDFADFARKVAGTLP